MIVSSPWERRSWPADPWLYLAIACGLFLRLWNLGGYELWADELHTHLIARSGLEDLLSPRFMAPYLPTYFLLGHLQAALGFSSEFALRILPASMGIALIPVMYAILGRAVDERAARIGAWMTAAHPLLIYFSREHRMYSLYTLSLALTVLACLRWRDRVAGGSIVIASSCLAAMTFPLALWYLLSLPLLIPLREGRRIPRLILLLLPAFGLGGLWMAAALPTITTSENAYYAFLDARQLFAVFKSFSVGNFSMTHGDLAPAAWIALPILGAASLFAILRNTSAKNTIGYFSLSFLTIPFAIIWLLQFSMGAIYNYKSFLPGVLPVIMLSSIGFTHLPRRIGRTGLILILLLAFWVDRAQLDRTHRYNWNTERTESFREWKRAVETLAPPADGVLLLDHVVTLQAMHYGSPHGLPTYADVNALLSTYPAANRLSMAAILERHGILNRDPRDTTAASLIAYPASSFSSSDWPAFRGTALGGAPSTLWMHASNAGTATPIERETP